MVLREVTEEMERNYLSKYAVKSSDTKGREISIAKCDMRSEFQRDRDRIIHSKAFRRLKHKTQVFFMPDNDHFRTRLTHTLEVSQIARTISRALRLNEDLTEAIALGHDLGHTPFGHTGEEALDDLLEDGFSHNKESLRIVTVIDNKGKGLNLTYEVLDGILNHRRSGNPSTLEGKVVSYADKIAYLNHDIDDAISAGVIKKDDIPKNLTESLGEKHGDRINNMIFDVVSNSQNQPIIKMSNEMEILQNELRDFMFENVYKKTSAKGLGAEENARKIIESLYKYYYKNFEEIPEELLARRNIDKKDVLVADYIAMMTDRYATDDYQRLFGESD